MKRCRVCDKEKELTEFYKRKDSPDGYRNDCKKCHDERIKITKREWRKRNGEAISKICKFCNKEFETKFIIQEFCSRKCKNKYRNKNPSENRIKWKKEYTKREEVKKRNREAKRKKYVKKKKSIITEEDRKKRKRGYQKEYYNNNKEYLIKKQKKYRKTKIGKAIDKNKQHKRRSSCKITDITSKWLVELKENTIYCSLCGDEMNENLNNPKQKHLDHIIPLNSKCGGTHTMNNVRYICSDCNLRRPKDGSDIL